LTITIAALLGIALPTAWIIVAFVTQAERLAVRISQMNLEADLRHLPAIEKFAQWLSVHLSISVDELLAHVTKNASGLVGVILLQGQAVVVGILSTGASIALMLFILFFALRGGDQAADRIIKLLPLREDHKQSLVAQMSEVTRATVLGDLVTAVAQGLLVGFSFIVTGLPSPVVFAVLAALASLIPIGGTALVWGPAAIVLLVQGRWGAALFVTLWGVFIVAAADNLIRPRFIAGRSQVPALGVFLGVLGGVPLFGLLGAFLGPIIIALALALLRFAQEERSAV